MVAARAAAWLRDWSTRFVRGAAALPTLLVGAQPYGVRRRALVTPPTGTPVGNIGQVESGPEGARTALGQFARRRPPARPGLRRTGATRPRRRGRSGLAGARGGAAPHVARRPAASIHCARSTGTSMRTGCRTSPRLYDALGRDGWPGPDYDALATWVLWQECDAALEAATTAYEQQRALEALAGGLENSRRGSPAPDAYYVGWAAWTRTSLVEFVIAHSQRGLGAAVADRRGRRGHGPAGLAERSHGVHQRLPGTRGGSRGPCRSWRRVAGDGVVDGPARTGSPISPPPSPGTGSPADQPADSLPLLRRLAAPQRGHWRSIPVTSHSCGTASGAKPRAGCVRWWPRRATRSRELERLLREALGPWAYRLDAWYAGDRRLAPGEQAHRAGPRCADRCLRLGVRRASPDRPGGVQGYVLAPSLTHATTAAILRSGWAAFGGSGESAGLADGPLVRTHAPCHDWIVDGVRRWPGPRPSARCPLGAGPRRPGADPLGRGRPPGGVDGAGDPAPRTASSTGCWSPAPARAPTTWTTSRTCCGGVDDLVARRRPVGRGGLGAVLDRPAATWTRRPTPRWPRASTRWSRATCRRRRPC